MRVSLKTVVEVIVWVGLLTWITIEVVSAYFGPTSYRALELKKLELAALTAEVRAQEDEYERLKRRADQLNDAMLDEDLLDERIRGVLGYIADGEWIASRSDVEAALAAADAQERNGQ